MIKHVDSTRINGTLVEIGDRLQATPECQLPTGKKFEVARIDQWEDGDVYIVTNDSGVYPADYFAPASKAVSLEISTKPLTHS